MFEHLSTPFHHGAILDMDLAYRRPLAVTCGSDRSVALWNHKSMTLDVHKQFQDDLHSVAIHPLGKDTGGASAQIEGWKKEHLSWAQTKR